MNSVLGIVIIIVGSVLLAFGPRLARARISLHYSHEQLRATSGPEHRRVRRATIITTVLNMAVGAAFIYFGIRGMLQ